jgi:murein hydrolase activator
MDNRINSQNILKIIVSLAFFLFISLTYAESNSITKNQQKLNRLEIKIDALEKKLAKAEDKQLTIEKELTNTNKRIKHSLYKLKKIKPKVLDKKAEIQTSQAEIDLLNKKYQSLQLSLSKYLYARYKLKETEPLEWLLNQDSIQHVDRLLTYYKYLVNANRELLDSIKSTKEELNTKQKQLDADLVKLKQLQNQWRKTLRKLHNDKKYHATLIKRLSNYIHKNKQTLKDYRISQINLTKLITSLTKKSVLQTRHPLTTMKNKLIRPVNVNKTHIKKMNQGLVFYTSEGTIVHAISPGKVVFSDWLNGYGMLIIIDHGWGFMSLYANNQALLKHKGDRVSLNEEIAKVGHSGTLPENGLYFEIRHHGKAIPPLEWLR